jgi:hypothetical protein
MANHSIEKGTGRLAGHVSRPGLGVRRRRSTPRCDDRTTSRPRTSVKPSREEVSLHTEYGSEDALIFRVIQSARQSAILRRDHWSTEGGVDLVVKNVNADIKFLAWIPNGARAERCRERLTNVLEQGHEKVLFDEAPAGSPAPTGMAFLSGVPEGKELRLW